MASLCTVFNDPVHGTIAIHPLCLKIIDTPEFQRLRNIRQCGICYLVYPSAVHTRFEHSIGVYYLAGVMLDHLRTQTEITDEDSLCVKIAALCHDLGHGPFSHLWEQYIKKQNNYVKEKEWHHEEMSLALFDQLITNCNLMDEFKKYKLQESHINLIKYIISGNYKLIEKKKLFLFEIVANKKTNIDVDRWDYMMRDAYFFGLVCPINYRRMVSSIKVKGTENGELRIAFRDKVRENILETFKFRMKLHKICYKHRVCKKIEIMLLDALSAADNCFFGNGIKLSDCHEKSVDTFLALNDGLLNSIISSENSSNEVKIILNRILKRDLYVDLFWFKLADDGTSESITNLENSLRQLEKNINETYGVAIRFGLIDINMGIKGNNPFKDVIFFNKDDNVLNDFCSESVYERELYLYAFSVNKIEEKDEEKIENIKKKVEKEIRGVNISIVN